MSVVLNSVVGDVLPFFDFYCSGQVVYYGHNTLMSILAQYLTYFPFYIS